MRTLNPILHRINFWRYSLTDSTPLPQVYEYCHGIQPAVHAFRSSFLFLSPFPFFLTFWLYLYLFLPLFPFTSYSLFTLSSPLSIFPFLSLYPFLHCSFLSVFLFFLLLKFVLPRIYDMKLSILAVEVLCISYHILFWLRYTSADTGRYRKDGIRNHCFDVLLMSYWVASLLLVNYVWCYYGPLDPYVLARGPLWASDLLL